MVETKPEPLAALVAAKAAPISDGIPRIAVSTSRKQYLLTFDEAREIYRQLALVFELTNK